MQEMKTAQLHLWVDRIREGDLAAREDLLRAADRRLRDLADRMLRKYPAVARWTEADDVLQSATLRLLLALQHIRPESIGDFYSLAAVQVRRELIDLARHYGGPRGHGRNCRVRADADGDEPPLASRGEEADLELWASFHTAVTSLPLDEREAMELVFYRGWTQSRVAVSMRISERTVQRLWKSATERIRAHVGDV